MTTRIVLADDQELLRATFRLLLDAVPDLEVVGEAATGAQAVAEAGRHVPDVVLMDIRMPGTDGIEATARITADPRLAGVRVLVLTTFEHDDLVVAALRAGASGFLGKGVSPDALVDAIRTVAAGDRLLSPAATRAVVERVVAAPGPAAVREVPGMADLTEREREITALVARGLSNDEIGRALFISPATAKTHVNRAMAKTAARDRAQLVVLAYDAGLVPPGSG
ncbi:response regulator transcription factor [Cellulomonas sp.]|uniref:response regulator n=1 Tax=Cellulomonas sp. TaxID=40001 RepID=UPI00258DAC68|nr:response regulator transcription factor [Cellulomonas sp.]MCR6689082.1 response regulator transcription factor [Cellulomonas sp.]